MNLQGKTALVTGGGRDIGRSVSIALARAGARVAINYNSGREAAEETLAVIKAAGGEAFLIQADVTDSGAVAAMLDEIGIAFSGRLDILVNNVGLRHRSPIAELTPDAFAALLDVNLVAAYRLGRLAAPHLAAGGGGSIVNITSIAGHAIHPFAGSAYCTSKAALSALTREMAVEFAELGVRVNAVAPGEIETAMVGPEYEALLPRIPMHRMGTPEEVAGAVYQLCKPRLRLRHRHRGLRHRRAASVLSEPIPEAHTSASSRHLLPGSSGRAACTVACGWRHGLPGQARQ